MRALNGEGMTRKERTHKVAIGALLHDIGKILQRAGRKPDFADMQEFAVRRNPQNQPAYEHAANTASFITKHLPDLWQGQGYDNVLNFAGRHHNPSSSLEWVIAEADRLSSGMDRDQEGPPPSDASSIPLEPVLARVFSTSQVTHFYKVKPFSIDRDTLFPVKNGGVSRQDYQHIYGLLSKGTQAIVEGYKKVSGQNQSCALEWLVLAIQSLLERLAWCIPAATTASPRDVSLYDHSRSSAAIASCIAYYDQSEMDENFVRDRKDPRFALTCIDISGIQAYLHALKSEGARRSLTGRSFYVQLLQDALATEVLKMFDLPPVCCIYQGGGKVWLLLPKAVLDDLRKWIDEVDASVWSDTGGLLSVSFGYSILSGNDFILQHGGQGGTNFGKHWTKALQNLRMNRLERMATLGYDRIFGTRNAGHTACQQCYGETSNPTGQCDHCKKTEAIGRRLGQVLVFRGSSGASLPRVVPSNIALPPPLGTGACYALVVASSLQSDTGIFLDTHLQDFKEWVNHLQNGRVLVYWPVAATPPVVFENLANRNPSVPMLAVLRADVDNLGKVFEQGLPAQHQTLSRLSALSRSLRDFFCGYVPNKIMSKWGQDVHIVFSGGDDVFIVGAFYRIPEVANFLRSELCAYACDNPSLTMSAGIEVQKPNSPILLTARRALDAEQEAKQFRPQKNAVCLFGTPLSWEELERAGALCNILVNGTTDDPSKDFGLSVFAPQSIPTVPHHSLPRSLLGVLGSIAVLYKVRTRVPRIQAINSHRYLWVTAYSLSRHAEQKRAAKAFLDYLKNEILSGSAPPEGVRPLVEFLDVVVEWAFLLTRA